MSEPMIRCRGLGKVYALRRSRAKAGYRTLREELMGWPRRWAGRLRGGGGAAEPFRALAGVDLDVAAGEVLGIVGRNGAGKSTLLKILSRITAPSEGEADLFGRVGSLLEVGTGFHPELTGRENIFLSGAMLGMRRAEVRRRFDEIVAFAEVERFLETPCKHYSSGMYARLGFAVAAHLEADILLVDEVLAVGDLAFQQRCLGKMASVARGGRTVLFVSHNLGAVASLCSRAVLLEDGRLRADGQSRTVIEAYLARIGEEAGATVSGLQGSGGAWIEAARLCDADGAVRRVFSMSERVGVRCDLRLVRAGTYTLSVQLKEMDFRPILHCTSGDACFELPGGPGTATVAIELPLLRLYPGRYWIRLALTDTQTGEQHEVERLDVQIEQDFGLISRPLPRQAGLIHTVADWRLLP
jgi:lipopolysaccharide transport system ATP-binding protein